MSNFFFVLPRSKKQPHVSNITEIILNWVTANQISRLEWTNKSWNHRFVTLPESDEIFRWVKWTELGKRVKGNAKHQERIKCWKNNWGIDHFVIVKFAQITNLSNSTLIPTRIWELHRSSEIKNIYRDHVKISACPVPYLISSRMLSTTSMVASPWYLDRPDTTDAAQWITEYFIIQPLDSAKQRFYFYIYKL